MTQPEESSISEGTNRRRGVAYAIAAAGLAAVFLFLPILLLGFTMQVVASVAHGEIVAWRSSVDLTYVFLGIPALLSILLLLIPLRLLQAAGRLIGSAPATRWVDGLLAAALGGVALFWLLQAQSRSAQLSQTPEIWYAAAFGVAALVTVVISVLIARRAIVASLAVLGMATAGVAVLVAMLVVNWGSPPRIPVGAQKVEIVLTPSGVELEPPTVRAGDVYFIVQRADDTSGHAEFEFIGAGYASPAGTTPLPLSDEGVERVTRGDYQGTASEGGWGQYSKLILLEGSYVFAAPPQGGQPGASPQSITVLEVRP